MGNGLNPLPVLRSRFWIAIRGKSSLRCAAVDTLYVAQARRLASPQRQQAPVHPLLELRAGTAIIFPVREAAPEEQDG